MKSILHHILLLFLAILSITACSDIDPFETDNTKGMELTIRCVNPNDTRATMPGDNSYNENAIKTIHYFLYVSGKTNENAVLKGKMNIAEGTNGQATIRIPMNEGTLNTIVFPRPIEECEVYLIANLPGGVLPEDLSTVADTRLATLQALAVTADFKGNAVQNSFVMTGQGKARITSRNKTVAAEGDITIERLAAKLTTRIAVANSFTDSDGKVWTPQVDLMEIHLDNAASNTTLAGEFGNTRFDYDVRQKIGTANGTIGEESVEFYVYQPFYSYPCKWDSYTDTQETMALYIKLPWQTTEGGTTKYQNCFYKVYPATMQLDPNSWYNLDLKIGVLGSFTEADDPIEITGIIYKVIDWKNGFADWSAGLNVDTELLSAHYLVVDQNNYVVNNKNTFEIPFITSHECEISELTVTRKVFVNGSSVTPSDQILTTTAQNNGWLTLEGNTIKLNHALNNDFINTSTYDYTPYTFTFTLRHKNNPDKFKETITIVQKPAISITAHLNSLYEATNGGTKSGYVYVNGKTSGDEWGGVGDVQANGNNSNPYMYTIEVSVLPPGSNYILGDPRTKYVFGTDIASQNSFTSAPPVAGGDARRLANYYGTIKDETVENMIAPKFRISSAHGRLPSLIGYSDVFNRAASYQEDGYPAGRWRVPTRAEVEFIYKLFLDELIPPLFYGTTAYWCANGKVQPSGNNVTFTTNKTGNSPVRCVYDEWYWDYSPYPRMTERGNHPNMYNQFTWGDEIN